jgi:hypothetical protein
MKREDFRGERWRSRELKESIAKRRVEDIEVWEKQFGWMDGWMDGWMVRQSLQLKRRERRMTEKVGFTWYWSNF